MKILKSLLTVTLLFIGGQNFAQITITSADMPSVNDNILISVNTSLNGFLPAATGPNHVWDYSFLIPDSQRVISHVSASTTPYTLYNFLATYGVYNYQPDQFPFSLLGMPPTNVYDFYKKTGTFLAIVGQGITVGGNAIPALYNAADRVYSFPITYLGKDSSNSSFSFPLPNIGYYAKKQKRLNEVDGWGTLTTPYGTFNTLRIKTTLTILDSIYLDTIHFGFTIPRQIIYQYKWFTNGKKIPLLEIDATAGLAGGLTIDRVNWRDSIVSPMQVNFTEQSSCPIVNEGSLTANITGGRYPLKFKWNTGDTTKTISNLAPGIYTVTIIDRYQDTLIAIDSVKTLNDSTCTMLINFTTTRICPAAKNGSVSATVSFGRPPLKYAWSTGDTTSAISNLAPGGYTLTVTDKYNRQVVSSVAVEGNFQDITCLNIPNAFTPDNDGTNDVWNIRSLKDFDQCKVEIFNQWGSLVFKSTGYNTPWDGKYNNEPVPAGTYYYVISLNNTPDKYTGTVTIIR